MSELTPVPKGMCPAFYQFMGAGSPRSDSGEILMLNDEPAPTPDAKLVAAAREALEELKLLEVHCARNGIAVNVAVMCALAAALAERGRV